MSEERKDAIDLLAEKVMKFPGLNNVTRDFLFANWNPFERPADAIQLADAMDAVKPSFFDIRIALFLKLWTVDIGSVKTGEGAYITQEGSDFAETLATAIHRLAVELPELFAEGK